MRTVDAIRIGMALGRISKTLDAWEESKHPRADNGQFSSGGSSATISGETKLHPEYAAAIKAVQEQEKRDKNRKPLLKPHVEKGSGANSGKLHPEYAAAVHAAKEKEKAAKKKKSILKPHVEGAEGYRKAINEQMELQMKYAREGNMKKANEAYKAGMNLYNEAIKKGIPESGLM